jgi:hypothetical protein
LSQENFQVVKRTATLVLLVVLVCCIQIKADVWPLVLTGSPVPGTANFRFIGFSQAVVNASGTIAFHAGFLDPSTNLTGQGIFEIQGGQLLPVMMEGQPLPDVPGAFGASGDVNINSSGDLVFIAYTSERPNIRFQAIFEQSGGALHRVVDFSTPPPGAAGETFSQFSTPQINDQGQIVFSAGLSSNNVGPPSPYSDGIFSISSAGLQAVALNHLTSDSVTGFLSLNNRGDLLLSTGSTFSIDSAGALSPAVSFPLTVPGTNYIAISGGDVTLNDDQSMVFAGTNSVSTGRGSVPYQNSVLRWRSGTLEKLVASSDPVPGFSGATFGSEFLSVHSNPSAAIFISRKQVTNGNEVGVLGRAAESEPLSILASEDQFVDGIGTLDFIGLPNFDPQGKLVTFLANAAAGTRIGIYAATAAPQYTLRFPQIADGGGGAAGGWRTTFVLANRSTSPSTATISFFDDSGAPLSLSVGGMQQTQTTVVVPALGVAQVQTQGGGPLTAGWALAQSDQNLTGIAIYGLLDSSGNSISEVGVPASLPLLSLSIFAQSGATTSTGVALANPNSTAANVTLILRDANSSELSRISVVIPAMGHLARYANELFTGIPPGEFEGKIDVISTQPLAGTTLRQRASVFTSLPIIP